MTSVNIEPLAKNKHSTKIYTYTPAGWYLDDDGDLLHIFNDLDRAESGIFAIIFDTDNGFVWLVKNNDVEDILDGVYATPLKTLDIKYD